MSKCLNCGNEVKQTEGRRPRKFCDNNGRCRGEHFRKNNPKEGKYVLRKTHEEMIKKFTDRIEKVLEENKEDIGKIQEDISTLGISIQETKVENGKVKVRHVDPISDEGFLVRDISELEERLKLPAKYLPSSKRTIVQNQLSNLKYQLKTLQEKN